MERGRDLLDRCFGRYPLDLSVRETHGYELPPENAVTDRLLSACGSIRQLIGAGLLLAILASVFLGAACANAATPKSAFVTYVLHGESGGVTENVPVTFGSVFAKGDVPAGSSVVATDDSGNPLTLQVDVKAKHPDGSLRHAVLTVVAPHLGANDNLVVALSRGRNSETSPLGLSALPRNFDASLILKMKDGRTLRASARALLDKGKIERWLSGSQATEWWVSGPLRDASGKADPYLSARFGIRSYGAGRPVRVEVDVENTWTWVPGPRTEFYDAQIIANSKTVFTQAGMAQPSYTRWRKVFWWDQPATVYVEQNLEYLKKARVVPNYAEDVATARDDLERSYQRFEKEEHGPLQSGIITGYMPMTGGRGDIAILPAWTVEYLMTMDKRGYEMTVVSGELSGGFHSHYRNTKTDRPVTAEEYPNLSTHSNYVGKPGNLELPKTDGYKTDLTPQRAHEPSLAFIPYLITGDRYFLEELEFWAQWNTWGTAPEHRGFKLGLVNWDEVRGQAWSMRTLAQAAYIAPDADPQKEVLLRELKNNIDYYDKEYVNNPNANVLHGDFMASKADINFSPWMDDYLTGVMGYIVDLGFESARPFATWKAGFPIQRMINKDYCWVLATTYRIVVQYPDRSLVRNWKDAYRFTFERFANHKVDPASVECNSQEMVNLFKLQQVGVMAGGGLTRGGYPSNLQPALAAAVDLNAPGATEAWNKFQARTKSKEAMYPNWNILPWPPQ
ncbi:MAG TPA: hypothetical protein VN682_07135 [Terriglobales bacterium]|nr:hypothetical protein [Terriglobales bacterium]